MKWVKLLGIALVTALAVLIVVPIVRQSNRVEELRKLAVYPTPKSEPGNRASYYLAAAEVVDPFPHEMTDALEERETIDWNEVAPRVEELIANNQQTLRLIRVASELDLCRMPILTDRGSGIKSGDSLREVGNVLFWTTLKAGEEAKIQEACELGLLNLRMGRDVAMAGSWYQTSCGIHIYLMASRSLATLVMQSRLDENALELLEQGLVSSQFPADFDLDIINANQRQWSLLVMRWPGHVMTGPTLGLNTAYELNPLVSAPQPQSMSFDSVQGIKSGVILLRMGVAIRRYVHERSQLPETLEDLVPEYLPEIPENPAGPPFEVSSTLETLEIVSPKVEWEASRRALSFSLDRIRPASSE